MKKAIPVIIAMFLILVIGGIAVGSMLYEKYSYSKEQADLDAYYQVSEGECAIVLQDELIEEKAIVRDGVCYLDLATVHKYLNDVFYVDRGEEILLYTTATEVIKTGFGSQAYTTSDGEQSVDYVICYLENDTLYVAMDYVKLFTNYSYEKFERQMQMYTQWGSKETAEIAKDTAVRYRGGVKSEVLRDLAAGETVEVLEVLENWSKVKTSDAMIGYVENKRLTNHATVQETPVTDYVAPEYTSLSLADKVPEGAVAGSGKVSLGWHAIGGVGGNSTLEEMVAGTKGMNVIAPTWFSINDEFGNFRNFGESSYVERAHKYGLQVWGVLDDFNYNNEKDADISVFNLLSDTITRQNLVQNVVNEAVNLGLDGINLDFERVTEEAGVHYVQFLRELSIQCRSNGLVFSIDNYVPFHFNDYYRLDVQGQVADYVIIMGYDEHWHGSGDPGSVASIDYVKGGIERTMEDVPAEKIVNALPFYTILWKIDGAKVTDDYLTLNNTADFMNRVGVKAQWDEETCQNYAEWTSGSVTYQIWLEDAESINVKLNVMNAHNIGGVAVWRLGYGTPVVWELLNAYVNS